MTKGLYPGLTLAATVSVSIGSLDHPDKVRPVEHGCADRLLPWLKIDDGLPRDAADVAAFEPEA
ncbi:MAG: hypothetical protein VCB77_04710 [Alphaproteobacteria bacterium]